MSKVIEKQIKKRSMIIETAISLMDDTPFDALSVTEICDAAGISTGTFYHYFEKKSDLLIGLLSIVDDYLEEKVFPFLTDENEPKNLLTLARGFAAHIDERGLQRSWHVSCTALSDISITGKKREIQSVLESVIERGQQKGQIIDSSSAAELARLFLIAMRGVAVDWTRRNGAYPLRECMEDFMALFIKALEK